MDGEFCRRLHGTTRWCCNSRCLTLAAKIRWLIKPIKLLKTATPKQYHDAQKLLYGLPGLTGFKAPSGRPDTYFLQPLAGRPAGKISSRPTRPIRPAGLLTSLVARPPCSVCGFRAFPAFSTRGTVNACNYQRVSLIRRLKEPKNDISYHYVDCTCGQTYRFYAGDDGVLLPNKVRHSF